MIRVWLVEFRNIKACRQLTISRKLDVWSMEENLDQQADGTICRLLITLFWLPNSIIFLLYFTYNITHLRNDLGLRKRNCFSTYSDTVLTSPFERSLWFSSFVSLAGKTSIDFLYLLFLFIFCHMMLPLVLVGSFKDDVYTEKLGLGFQCLCFKWETFRTIFFISIMQWWFKKKEREIDCKY